MYKSRGTLWASCSPPSDTCPRWQPVLHVWLLITLADPRSSTRRIAEALLAHVGTWRCHWNHYVTKCWLSIWLFYILIQFVVFRIPSFLLLFWIVQYYWHLSFISFAFAVFRTNKQSFVHPKCPNSWGQSSWNSPAVFQHRRLRRPDEPGAKSQKGQGLSSSAHRPGLHGPQCAMRAMRAMRHALGGMGIAGGSEGIPKDVVKRHHSTYWTTSMIIPKIMDIIIQHLGHYHSTGFDHVWYIPV